MLRVTATILILALALSAPWPYVWAVVLAAMLVFPKYAEGVVILALSDAAFGLPRGILPPAYAFLFGLAAYLIIAFVRRRVLAP